MQIRLADETDIEAIANLHAASWRSAYRGALSDEYLAGDIVSDRMRVWTQRLSTHNQDQNVLVAEQGRQVVGFACAFAFADSEWGSLLDNVHVSQECHRSGVGTALIQHIMHWHLEKSPAASLFLWVLQSNRNAQQFYEKLGAKNVGEDVWVPPDGGSVPRFRYAWSDVSTAFNSLT